MGAIGRVVRNSGLDDRFTFFVSGTMALSILIFAGIAAVMSLLMGDAKSAMQTLVAVPLGGVLLFWVAVLHALKASEAEIVMGVCGMVAVLVAPRVARWAYKDGIDAPEPDQRAAAQRGPHDAC